MAPARIRGVLRDEGDHRGSCTSQGCTQRCGGVNVAPARLRGVLRDEEGSPWLLHVLGVYSEMKGVTVVPAHLWGVLRDEGDHRGSFASQGCTYSEMKGVTVAPARLRGVLRDEEGSPVLLHVSGVYSEMRRGHRGSCTSQGCTCTERGGVTVAPARLRGVPIQRRGGVAVAPARLRGVVTHD